MIDADFTGKIQRKGILVCANEHTGFPDKPASCRAHQENDQGVALIQDVFFINVRVYSFFKLPLGKL